MTLVLRGKTSGLRRRYFGQEEERGGLRKVARERLVWKGEMS